jgi:hypothetical protein
VKKPRAWIRLFTILILFLPHFVGQGMAPSVETGSGPPREPASLRQRRDSAAARNGIQILPMNSKFPASKLAESGYEVKSLADRLKEDAALEPEPKQRDLLFMNSGVWTFASRLDQLDRSFLFLRAQDYSREEFQRAYPVLNEKARLKLQAAAKAWGR